MHFSVQQAHIEAENCCYFLPTYLISAGLSALLLLSLKNSASSTIREFLLQVMN